MDHYYRNPANGWVHEDDVSAMMADNDAAFDELLDDYNTAAAELGWAEDCLAAIAAVVDATSRGDWTAPSPYLREVLAAWVANDKPFIYSVLAVAGEEWAR